MTFDYKKYSLENLKTWVEDALNSAEASPQEIYDCIRKVVEDNYYCYKNSTSRCYELLALLNGNGKGHIPAYDEYLEKKENLVCDKDNPSPECKKSWTSFWEENYYPEEYNGSTVSSVHSPFGQDSSQWTYKGKPATYQEIVADGWEMTADGFWFRGVKEDKVKKWVLPVEEVKDEDTDENIYCVSFPDDLLEAANLKEGDQVEWVDNGDGSYLLRKVTQPLEMSEC